MATEYRKKKKILRRNEKINEREKRKRIMK